MTALVGALRVSLSADTAKFEQGMKRAQRTAQTSSSAISKSLGVVKAGVAGFVSGLSIGLVADAVRKALDYAGSLGEVSQQLGVTTRDLQVFRYAAGQNGVAQEQLDKALGKLTVTLGQVAAGAKAPTKALQAIGITAQELAGKDTGEAFRMIADGLAKIPDRAQRAAVEVALFGRAGAQLDTLLAGGSASINELSQAAERLGIVLSDEQIQKADETADKLDALQTVLSAQIAGIVADNSDAILQLANSFSHLGRQIPVALAALRGFYHDAARLAAEAQIRAIDAAEFVLPYSLGGANRAANRKQAERDARWHSQGGTYAAIMSQGLRADEWGPKPSGGTPLPQFLGGGGGGGRSGPRGKTAEQLAEEALRKQVDELRDANQFDQELRRAKLDVLRATQSLQSNYIVRAQTSLVILESEKAAHEAQLQYEVALHKLTKGEQGRSEAQAAQLRAEYDLKDALEYRAVIADREAQRAEDAERLNALSDDLDMARLRSEAQLAETAAEQRDVELRLLNLAYQQERVRLQAIVAEEESKDIALQNVARLEEARRRLQGLNETYGSDRQGVLNNTRGPWENYMASLPTTAAKTQEALEQLQVQGFEGLIDAAMELRNGFGSAKDALLETLQSFLLGLLRLQMQRSLGSMLPAGGFKIPGFATGGAMTFGGIGGTDRNLLSMNGLPIARVSRGETMHITPANGTGSGRGDVHMTVYADNADSFRRSEAQITREIRRRIA